MHLGIDEVLKNRRKSLKVPQETLAKISGVSLRTIKGFEAGKGNPTIGTVQKLADALGLELSLKVKPLQTLI
ncbi:MAG: helix-turn-helix transcriptional regulator [Bacteroidota bacterium]